MTHEEERRLDFARLRAAIDGTSEKLEAKIAAEARRLVAPNTTAGMADPTAVIVDQPLQAVVLQQRGTVDLRRLDFTLVPWRDILERNIGKAASGILRSDDISWQFGRGRSGPTIS